MNFEQRAGWRDKADCCHTTPSSYQIRYEMAAVTSHSIKMERQCIFTSQFGQAPSDLNFPSKSTCRDGPIAWPPRSLDPTILNFCFFFDKQRILFTFHHFNLSCCNLMPGRELQRLVAPAICIGATGAGLRTVTPLHISTSVGQ